MSKRLLVVHAQATSEAHLYVDGLIGAAFFGGITAVGIREEIKQLPPTVTRIVVHVNSAGGDPFEATAIANALRAERTEGQRTVEAIVEGLAASAASLIAMAGDPVSMRDNAMVMI